MKTSTKFLLGAAAAGLVYYQYKKAKEAVVVTVTETINPASDQNIVYRSTQAAGHSLGAWIYRVTH